jgi:PAS domain S-box-containing protein
MQSYQNIEIDDISLGKLFPFYFVLDRTMRILKCSKIVQRLFCFNHLDDINDRFKLYAPHEGFFQFEDITSNLDNQHVFGSKDAYGIKLLGEFSSIANGQELLFTGHPYLEDILDPNANLLKPYDLFNSPISSKETLTSNLKNHYDTYELKNISLIINDEEGKIEWCNRVFQQLTHYPISEILGKRPRQIIYGPESNYVFADHVDTMVQDGKPFSFENIGYTKEGEKFWFHATVFPIINAQGVLSGRFSLLRDITQDKLNEIISSENELLLRFTLESTGDAIFVYDNIRKKQMMIHCSI